MYLRKAARGDRLAAESPDRLAELDRGEAPPGVEHEVDDELEERGPR